MVSPTVYSLSKERISFGYILCMLKSDECIHACGSECGDRTANFADLLVYCIRYQPSCIQGY